MMSWIDLYKFSDLISGITHQKLIYIVYIMKLGQILNFSKLFSWPEEWCMHAIAVLGYLAKLKSGLRLASGWCKVSL